MKKTKLIIGAHYHTPFGLSDQEFETEYKSHYKPFIASIYKYPNVPVALHFSGVLLDWLEAHHPEFFMILEELINRKQVEILGGGFYDPMLPLIPLADRLGQIEALTTYLRKHFGKRPRGCWLPGLIWEQNLAGSLQTSGMDYTFLESNQFSLAGLSSSSLERPCLTEDQGKIVTVFPLSCSLTDLLAGGDLEAFGRAVREHAEDGGEKIVTVFVERSFLGEASALDEGRFCAFLDFLARSDDSFERTLPSRVLKVHQPHCKAYFPSSAERSVMFWAMDENRRRATSEFSPVDSESADPDEPPVFFGAFPRHFLTRYPEANGIYTKMIYTHILINQLRGDKYRKRTAREELWKAQGCDSFWHVSDGGIYRNHLRKAVYGALIAAEKITREKGIFIPSVTPLDLNLDGDREFLFQGSDLNCYVKPLGGALFELDLLSKAWNYVDTFTRRRESYVDGDSVVDDYTRSAFVDRLLHPQIGLKDAVANNFPYSRNCAAERYEEISIDRVHQDLSLRKSANLAGPFGGIEIVKRYQLKKNTLVVNYTLSNRGEKPERFNFAPEIDLSFAGEGTEHQRLCVRSSAPAQDPSPLAESEFRGIDELSIEDVRNGVQVILSSASAFDLWTFPIRTVCRIGGVTAEAYQATCCMPVLPVILVPGESWDTKFTLRIGR